MGDRCADIYTAAPSTPIAVASSYSNVSTGFESWIEMLSLSNSGIEVDSWSGNINDWLVHESHPSALANSTANPITYGSVAVTATGQAFGVVSNSGKNFTIQSWQVADDYKTWVSAGLVDIGAVWN